MRLSLTLSSENDGAVPGAKETSIIDIIGNTRYRLRKSCPMRLECRTLDFRSLVLLFPIKPNAKSGSAVAVLLYIKR